MNCWSFTGWQLGFQIGLHKGVCDLALSMVLLDVRQISRHLPRFIPTANVRLFFFGGGGGQWLHNWVIKGLRGPECPECSGIECRSPTHLDKGACGIYQSSFKFHLLPWIRRQKWKRSKPFSLSILTTGTYYRGCTAHLDVNHVKQAFLVTSHFWLCLLSHWNQSCQLQPLVYNSRIIANQPIPYMKHNMWQMTCTVKRRRYKMVEGGFQLE